MRESGVASIGKRPTQGPNGSGATHVPAPPGTLSYGQECGNQAFLSLLGRSAVQRKLRVGPAHDRFEQEADRAADAVVRATYDGGARGLSSMPGGTSDGMSGGMPGGMIVQRKCAKCEEEDEEVVIRRSPRDGMSGDSVDGRDAGAQESIAAPEPAQTQSPETQAPVQVPSPETESPTAAPAPVLLLDDEVETVNPSQMTKTAFLDALRPAVCAAVDQGLAGTGKNSDGCPHVEYWFGHLAGKDASFIERGIQRFAPEARAVRTASEYIPAVAARVQQSTEAWALTGEVQGVPEEFAGAVAAGEALMNLVGDQPAARIRFKARHGGARQPDSPEAVRDELGQGRPLDGSVRARMESAYGTRFGHVRVHTDATGARLSDRLNARAFAVGEHVAFGAGEYRPGSLLGDALIAHELAHVVQQGGSAGSVASMENGSASHDHSLEGDADRSAAGVVASLWSGSKAGLGDVARNAIPRLRSGLRLSSCKSKQPCTTQTTPPTPRKTVTVRHSHLWGGGSAGDFARHVAYADTVYNIAGIDIVAGTAETINETDTKAASLLGTAATVDVSGNPPRSSSYTTEEKALLAHNSGGGEVTAYYIKEMDNVDLWGLAYRDSDKLLLEPQVSDRVLAHEIGHLLIALGHPSNNDNIMAQSSDATGVDCLSDDQISDARNSSLAK